MRQKLCILVPAHWEALMGGSQYQAKVLIDYLLEHYDVDIAYLTTIADPSFTPEGYRIVRFSDKRGLRRYGKFFDVVRLYRALCPRAARHHSAVRRLRSHRHRGAVRAAPRLQDDLARDAATEASSRESASLGKPHRWLERCS